MMPGQLRLNFADLYTSAETVDTVILLSRLTSTYSQHEVLISVPFHDMRPWSFLGMMFQVPLVFVTKALYRKFPGSSVGNIIFWVTFCVVGQPMAVSSCFTFLSIKRRRAVNLCMYRASTLWTTSQYFYCLFRSYSIPLIISTAKWEVTRQKYLTVVSSAVWCLPIVVGFGSWAYHKHNHLRYGIIPYLCMVPYVCM